VPQQLKLQRKQHQLLRSKILHLSFLREVWKFPALTCVFLCLYSQSVFGGIELEIRNRTFITSPEFSRIPELFTGREYSGTRLYTRSDPSSRSGFYFVVKVKAKGKSILSDQSHWSLDWVSSSSPEVQSVKLPVMEKDIFGKEVFIGLTGEDWPDQSIKLLAWRLRLMENDLKPLSEKQSFLWSK